MSYEGIKLSPARLPVASDAALGAVLIGENISHLAGTISLTEANVTSALGFTPIDKAGDTLTGMLTLSADPTDALHAATKQYVDSLAQGLSDFKDPVRAVATSSITLAGEQTIDSVSVVTGDRVLVVAQANAAENGIYIVATGTWPRSEDAQVSADVTPGMYALVNEGEAYGGTSWVLATSGMVTLDVTELVFKQFSSSAQTAAGNGLSKVGNVLAVEAADSTLDVSALGVRVNEQALSNVHFAEDAAVAYSKLNLAASVVDADIAANAAIAYSKLNLSASIVDSDIAADAALSYSKLNLTSSVVNADVAEGAGIAYSKLNLTEMILDADIAPAAAIAYSKLFLYESIRDTDIAPDAGIGYSKLNLHLYIQNSDIAIGAGIEYSKLNLAGAIVGTDIAMGAIDYSKLSLLASIVDADVAEGAEIADSKLATIQTPGKVSDTALSANVVLKDAAATFTGEMSKLTVIPAGASGAGLNVPHGSAPLSPVDGDVWTTTDGLYAQINGTSVQIGAGGGSVTSVDLAMPAIFTVSGNPVTDSGTLTAELTEQGANLVFAAPDGAPGVPEFRALVAADLPVATDMELGVVSASTGLAVTAGALSVDLGTALRTVQVVTDAGGVACSAVDDVVVINKGVGEATMVSLPSAPAVGKQVVIKDGKGDAATNNITVVPDSGTIDGAITYVIDSNYSARLFVFNGYEWNVL